LHSFIDHVGRPLDPLQKILSINAAMAVSPGATAKLIRITFVSG
jgi:hypothetical protein